MNGMNVSVSAGWYTFANLGPATTTFTPAPSCTASNRIGLGYVNPTGGNVVIQYSVQCTSDFNYFSGCVPTTTSTFTATSYEASGKRPVHWEGFGAYYSPGLYCPFGWATVGVAARDTSSSLTSAGILVPTATTTVTTQYSPGDPYYAMVHYEDPASVLKGVLKPMETLALCCPSAMTADTNGGCYSIVRDYTPSVGCQVATGYNYGYSESPYTYTYPSASVTRTGYREVTTTTVSETNTFSTTLDREEQTYYTALSYAPMITLLHHQSDLQSASASATSAATSNAATSNAASTAGASASFRDGVGSMFGISAAAAALGSAIIFLW